MKVVFEVQSLFEQSTEIVLDAKACEMDVLLQRLFYFSKMETGNMPFYLQVTDLNEFIRKFVEGCKNDLETKGASISFETSGKFHRASIDIEQMQRVLTNLVENSLKYANTGSLEIKISLNQEKHREVIVVSDNGSGVDPDKLPHLFEQFYRGDESVKNTLKNATVSYKATLVASDEGIVSGKVDGKVVQVMFENGKYVSQGDQLIKLDDQEIRNNIAASQAKLKASESQLVSSQTGLQKMQLNIEDAERSYDRTKELFDAGAISKVELESAETTPGFLSKIEV